MVLFKKQEIWVSDHFPLVGAIHLLFAVSPLVWSWPPPFALPPSPSPFLPWLASPSSLTEWNHVAKQWISNSFGIPVVEKNLVSCKYLPVKRASADKEYAALSAALRAVHHVTTNPPSDKQLLSAKKKLCALNITCDDQDLPSSKRQLKDLIAKSLDRRQNEALKD